MYLLNSVKTPQAIEDTLNEPGGPKRKFDAADIAVADRMEVWGSSFKDKGPDFVEYRLIDNRNNIMAYVRQQGY